MTDHTASLVGARWPDLSIEIEVLASLGVRVRRGEGRNSLVDTEALVEGLTSGRRPEPPDFGAFGGVDNGIIFTPHMAWYSEESEGVLRRSAAEEARRLLLGEDPLHPVVAPL